MDRGVDLGRLLHFFHQRRQGLRSDHCRSTELTAHEEESQAVHSEPSDSCTGPWCLEEGVRNYYWLSCAGEVFWKRRAADAFLADPIFWKPARRCIHRPEFGAVLTDTVIVSSQGVCSSDLIDHRENEAAPEASHKNALCFLVSKVVVVFSLWKFVYSLVA